MEQVQKQPDQNDQKQYKEERLNQLKELGIEPYPYNYQTNSTFDHIIQNYEKIEDGTHNEDTDFFLTGRIKAASTYATPCISRASSKGSTLRFVCNKSF